MATACGGAAARRRRRRGPRGSLSPVGCWLSSRALPVISAAGALTGCGGWQSALDARSPGAA
jgi:hypothetical protein